MKDETNEMRAVASNTSGLRRRICEPIDMSTHIRAYTTYSRDLVSGKSFMCSAPRPISNRLSASESVLETLTVLCCR
jgi:hypothetical protein